MPRLAFTEPSIGSTTTRSGPPAPNDALAELLRDEDEVAVERLEPRDDRVLGGRVDRRRVVAALARAAAPARARPASAAREDGLDVRDARRGRTRASRSRLIPGGRAGRETSFGKK